MLKRFVFVNAAVALALVGSAGCSDNRPAYVTPNLPPSQAATVKGIKGVFISAVDGAKVKTSGVTVMGVIGGNSVTMSPGEHAVECTINTSNFHSTSRFNYSFDAGTSYEIGPNSIWFPRSVQIKNMTTGATVEPQ